MGRVKVLIAGDESAAALADELRRGGDEVALHQATSEPSAGSLAAALGELERLIEKARPDVAISSGRGDLALALAISASKLGIPLKANAIDETDSEGRIILTLAANLESAT